MTRSTPQQRTRIASEPDVRFPWIPPAPPGGIRLHQCTSPDMVLRPGRHVRATHAAMAACRHDEAVLRRALSRHLAGWWGLITDEESDRNAVELLARTGHVYSRWSVDADPSIVFVIVTDFTAAETVIYRESELITRCRAGGVYRTSEYEDHVRHARPQPLHAIWRRLGFTP